MVGVFAESELVVDHHGAPLFHHHAVGPPDRPLDGLLTARSPDAGAVGDDDLVLVAHDVPSAVEPSGDERIVELATDRGRQRFGIGGRQCGVGDRTADVVVDLFARGRVLEGAVHQNAEIARGEFHLLALLEITVRREPQPQVGDGRRVVVQNDVQRSFRRLLLLGFGCGRDAELERLARLAGRITARRAAEPCDVAVVSETLQQQRPDVGAPLRLRDEDAEHLDGARQRHVEQVDIVDVRVDQLAVVGFRKERFAHRPLVAHRKFAERRQRRGLHLFGARCGPYDIVGAAARLGVERPVAVGDQHHLLFESFGLVDGHDLDRRFALVDAERACGPLLFPPVEEKPMICS